MTEHRQPVVLCLASYFKGGRFLQACKNEGAHVILLTKEKFRYDPWPFQAIDEFHFMPDLSKQPDVTFGASYLARQKDIGAVVALDEYDALTAADLREHFRLRGLGHTKARYFRDKLAMRTRARRARIRQPRFEHVLHHADVTEFVDTVPPPWVIKPRMEASAMGIRKFDDREEVWRHVHELGDQQSNFLLEEFVAGDVFHVDSIVSGGQILFTAVSKYETPPLNTYQHGGVFQTTTVDGSEPAVADLNKVNKRLLRAFGLEDGVAHAEFIVQHDTGKVFFLEVAARVGGAGIDQLVEAAYGVNLWEEWGRIVTLPLVGRPYELPPTRSDHAGLVVCLSKQEQPDMSAFNGEEVFWRLEKKHHAGLVLRSSSGSSRDRLVREYRDRFAEQFLATEPPLEKAPD